MLKVISLLFLGVVTHADTCFFAKVESRPAPETKEVYDKEVWCHHHFQQGGRDFQLIYNRDNGLKPELSFLIDQKDQSVATGYRLQGVTHFHQGAPLEAVPQHVLIGAKTASFFKSELKMEERLQRDSIIRLLQVSPKLPSITKSMGNDEYYLPEHRLPYRGYWWPTRNLEMITGSQSPLRLFDSIAKRLYPGVLASSADWERRNHAGSARWSGHCNGWASAAILNPEPMRSLFDVQTRQSVSPSIQKAWLAESHFCTKNAFYGGRHRNDGDDPEDFSPARFHRLLRYYIRGQGKPVVLDIQPYSSVENHIVTGYRMQVRSRRGRHRVKATLRMHAYSSRPSNSSGKAPSYEKTYRYTIYDDGRAEWSSRAADFLWVPLAQEECGNENPHVRHDIVTELMGQLQVR